VLKIVVKIKKKEKLPHAHRFAAHGVGIEPVFSFEIVYESLICFKINIKRQRHFERARETESALDNHI